MKSITFVATSMHRHGSVRRAEDDRLPLHRRFGVLQGRIPEVESLNGLSVPLASTERDVSEQASGDLDRILNALYRYDLPSTVTQRDSNRRARSQHVNHHDVLVTNLQLVKFCRIEAQVDFHRTPIS
jgi:hypothetical protein